MIYDVVMSLRGHVQALASDLVRSHSLLSVQSDTLQDICNRLEALEKGRYDQP